MAFSTTSFFAGVGTVFAAVTIGFAGGSMITTSLKVEPNRLERVAASAPIVTPIAVKAETPAVPPAHSAKTETTETAPPPARVIAMTPAPRQQSASSQPQPLITKDANAAQIGSAQKVREGELRKEAESTRAKRRAEARRERRKRQETEAAGNAVRQPQRDGGVQELSQRDDTPRFGFFGND